MDPVVELLDRQAQFLLGLDDRADFFAQVEPFVRALQSEARLAVHLQDLESELVDDVRVLEEVDEDLTAELIKLRQELVELVPELDDSDAALPQPGMLDMSAEYTLAFFDDFAARPRGQMNIEGNGGKAATLLGILRGKDLHPEVGPLAFSWRYPSMVATAACCVFYRRLRDEAADDGRF